MNFTFIIVLSVVTLLVFILYLVIEHHKAPKYIERSYPGKPELVVVKIDGLYYIAHRIVNYHKEESFKYADYKYGEEHDGMIFHNIFDQNTPNEPYRYKSLALKDLNRFVRKWCQEEESYNIIASSVYESDNQQDDQQEQLKLWNQLIEAPDFESERPILKKLRQLHRIENF